MQVRKAAAIGFDGEYNATARVAAVIRRPIQGVARQCQSSPRIAPVAATSELMQGRESLRRHPTSRHRAQAGYQRGHEEQVFNAHLLRLILLITGSGGKTSRRRISDWSQCSAR